MELPEFAPLSYLATWPPPDPPVSQPLPISRIPVLGSVIEYFRWHSTVTRHERQVLLPIGDEIERQLEARPVSSAWPSDPEERKFVEIVADAVWFEKCLTHKPALHPDDPFPLIFWGPFDDLTPVLVRSEVRKLLNRAMPGGLFGEAWREGWTLQQFMNRCLELPIEPPRPARRGWWPLNRLLGRQKPA